MESPAEREVDEEISNLQKGQPPRVGRSPIGTSFRLQGTPGKDRGPVMDVLHRARRRERPEQPCSKCAFPGTVWAAQQHRPASYGLAQPRALIGWRAGASSSQHAGSTFSCWQGRDPWHHKSRLTKGEAAIPIMVPVPNYQEFGHSPADLGSTEAKSMVRMIWTLTVP